MRLQKLFEPTRIGSMTVKNRIVMPAMDTNLGTRDGFVTSRLIDYYRERAKGGAGLIIVECTSVDFPRGKISVGQLSIDDDKYLDGLSELATAMKDSGARAAIQLEHGGGVTHSSIAGHPPMGPSASISPLGEQMTEMSIAQIEELVGRFADAAARAKKAGFDGAEIHGAHEHLLAQFIAPSVNHREDEYGGSLENRARILLQVTRACRAAVGPDYPLWCRIDGAEYGVYPAIDRFDAGQVGRWAQEAGADAVHVSGHGYGADFVALCPGMPGQHLAGAAEVKRNVSVPVIAVGRIYAELGEWALREGVADLIAMGRALIADPYLPAKAAEGRPDDVVPCIGCWECVEGNIQAVVQSVIDPDSTSKGDIECSVNPAAGREADSTIVPSASAKRVVVVGGGPAGMEAARVSRLRGHDVTLMEKASQLGGQLIPGAAPPHKEGISLLVDYLDSQLRKLGVEVLLEKEATLENITSTRPDEVVWAAGTTPVRPEIEGLDQRKVAFAVDVLSGKAEVGETVVIIGGDGTGCETAHLLADRGKRVTVVEVLPQVLSKEGTIIQMQLLEELARKGVELLTSVKYEGFDENGPIVRTANGELRTLQADSYVLAAGARSNSDIVPSLRERLDGVHVIGDALEPRRIRHAMYEGFEVGRQL
jgi:2,4-dienoyl-CoA reductase-like NADH-dependent reductase (Old Yellow Enzyme family)/thioredoxin reductase